MIDGRLGRRYAKALFQLAKGEDKEEAIGQEIEAFLRAYDGSSLITVLNNPAFSLSNRKKILLQIADALLLSLLSRQFLSLLLDRHRLTSLSSIVFHYCRFLYEAKGRVKARVVVSAPLGDSKLEVMQSELKKICEKEVILEQEIDPALIGGALIELEGKIYDGSIRAQLERIKTNIERGY